MADGLYNVESQGDLGFDWNAALSDPNILRALGEVGAGMGGKGSMGETLGNAGSNLARRKAMQKAAAQQSQRQQTFQDKLIQALAQGQLLSDPEDNSRPDSVSIDGKGNITLKAAMADKKPVFGGEQTPLEGIARRNRLTRTPGFNETGGSDLPGFLAASLG